MTVGNLMWFGLCLGVYGVVMAQFEPAMAVIALGGGLLFGKGYGISEARQG